MKCANCGNENNGHARFCQSCGAPLPFGLNSLTDQLRLFLKDPLFLAVCILYSIHIGFSLISGELPILNILMTIFLWLLFSQGRKGIVASNYIRCISGTVFASYVVRWVIYCAMAFCGVLLLILCFFLDTTRLLDLLYYKLYSYLGSYISSYIGSYFSIFTTATAFYLLLVSIGVIFVAIGGIVINLLGRRSIHRFVQSIYKGLENGQSPIVKYKAAKAWLLVFGIFNGIGAVSSFTSRSMTDFLAEGCLSAALIIGSLLAGKYFDGFQ